MSKRKNGEGSFDKVTINGSEYYRWRGTLGYNPDTGKPKTKIIYAPTEKELRAKVSTALDEYDNNIKVDKRLTTAQWLRQWLDECGTDWKPKTMSDYKSTVEYNIIPALGGIRLCDLQPRHVQRFVNGLKLSPKSVKGIHGVLHSALAKAVQWRYIDRNPADGIKLPRIEKKEVNFLANDDLRRFLQAIDGNPYADIMRIAVFTGMREGELIGLSWKQVDFKKQTITVNQQIQLIDGKYELQSTKSDRARLLSPSPFVFEILAEVRMRQNEMAARLGDIYKNELDLVFTKTDGSNIARHTLYLNFKRCLAKADLPETTRFHDLRHSYAVFALESGDNIKQVQSALGHYSTSFTLNIYEHVSDEARRRSAQRQQESIDRLLDIDYKGLQ